uniref:Putative secreted peptide n=1 Tax=Anopheles braziliensis TaxID=58242 RepID=A0A2M3ZP96_9DIPT
MRILLTFFFLSSEPSCRSKAPPAHSKLLCAWWPPSQGPAAVERLFVPDPTIDGGRFVGVDPTSGAAVGWASIGRDCDSFIRRCSSLSKGDFGNAPPGPAITLEVVPPPVAPITPFSWYSKLVHDSPRFCADEDFVSAVVVVVPSKSRS